MMCGIFSGEDLNDGELDSMCKGIACDPFSYAEGSTLCLKRVRFFTCRASLVVTPCSDVQSDVEIMGVSSRKSTRCESIMEFDSLVGILRLLSFG